MRHMLSAVADYYSCLSCVTGKSCHCWQVYYTLNGELVGQGYSRPAAHLAATLYPAVGLHTPGVQAVFNFGNNSSSSSSSTKPFMFDASTAAAKLAPAAVAAKSDMPTASGTSIEQVSD
jgi:hypothetical protein